MFRSYQSSSSNPRSTAITGHIPAVVEQTLQLSGQFPTHCCLDYLGPPAYSYIVNIHFVMHFSFFTGYSYLGNYKYIYNIYVISFS